MYVCMYRSIDLYIYISIDLSNVHKIPSPMKGDLH